MAPLLETPRLVGSDGRVIGRADAAVGTVKEKLSLWRSISDLVSSSVLSGVP